ncbi:NAD(+) synthase [Brachyspira hyodysenteriae]|uniref:Glutamine-dependent NAD(+) synthetase n=2 Tax=Brachyspira hyodysenteriae TaxID=159 RepID=A0A3B6VC63_BRAHW|nr:NAD(+) synthase [Brachyspira hyodysenteriae]ACN82981.1 D+ synthetase [Brachyspira hyodysenteriae WA1]ANN62428.1 NAD(+) synthase [Brachyspira hyodysenteriae ATCC 27164]KLI24211.1 NAD+ synthetase [Brachyspira hyodysenteriae]KLI28052.1 NAD+ synthetase [Brachyspira hyodysenteriae]KLI37920.1 NAD+ synthetase [Brachyspira hyodysenteriae]
MKIAVSQLEIIPSMPCDNTVRIISFISKAKKENADIVIFPELCISGYMIGDMFESEGFIRECEELGEEIIKSSNGIYVIFGNVASDRKKKNFDGRIRKYNAMFVAKDGKLIHNNTTEYPFIIKSLLPNYKEFEDPRHFFSLKDLAFENNTDIKNYLKPLEIECNGEKIKLGLTICEDAWSKNYLFSPMDIINTNKDVDLFINISSSPYTLVKDAKRHSMYGEIASKHNTPLVYTNNVGIQNNGKTVYTFDGGSSVYDNNGNLLLTGKRYEEDLYFIDIDVKNKSFGKTIEIKEENEYKLIYDTVIYGIRKFMKSIGINKVVIGVSGGIDSALSSAMYVNAIGKDNVLLVNMPSKFNSNTTKNLAKTLSDNLGCAYMVVPIQESVDYTVKQLETSPIIKEGKEDHLKLSSFVIENIQARDRSSRVLSAIAASFGGVFTCNANKTETMVGYSTMYGDGAGFFACLADLWKYQIYGLANYVNKEVFKKEIIPEGTINIVPSAELSTAQAVDEGKGDPIKYDYHDYLFKFLMESWNRAILEDILEFYIEGNLEEKIGCQKGILKKYFKSGAEFVDDLERWWKQYMGMGISKRIQAPPILAVSRRSFGFGNRESQNRIYYTAKYLSLKNKIFEIN